MFVLIGVIVVLGCVAGGFLAGDGHIAVLWQPFEFLIIFGAMLGGMITGTPAPVLKSLLASLPLIVKGGAASKATYVELLSTLYSLFKVAKSKGDIALEAHIEKPAESPIFQAYGEIARRGVLMEFICDNLRLLTLGSHNPHELEAIMDAEIDAHRHHHGAVAGVVSTAADGLPALGIVAAVLGVIHTMGAITEPPEVLGHLIGAALVGTFSGVLAAYGFVAPIGKALEARLGADEHVLEATKTALVAHTQGYAPQISVEFARKTIATKLRPTFVELDEKLNTIQV